MLDTRLVRLLDKETCLEHQEAYRKELDLTDRRLERLRKKQEQNPNFSAYDVYADDQVDICTRIEEFEAVKDELEWYLELIEEQLSILKLKENHPGCKVVKHGAQLSLLDKT